MVDYEVLSVGVLQHFSDLLLRPGLLVRLGLSKQLIMTIATIHLMTGGMLGLKSKSRFPRIPLMMIWE